MKSPAFQWYPNDFLGSGKVAAMSLEEIGAYTVLLCYDWNDGGLPDNTDTMARWLRLSPRRFAPIWEAIKENFVLREGRWFNPRLEKERAKQKAWREKSSKGGKAGSESRWHGGGDKGGNEKPVTVVTPPLSPPNDIASASAFASAVPSFQPPAIAGFIGALPDDQDPTAWRAIIDGWKNGLGLERGVAATAEDIATGLSEYLARADRDFSVVHVKSFVERARRNRLRAVDRAPTGKYSPELLVHSDWLYTVLTEGGFTQPASWESLVARAERRTDIPDQAQFLKELRVLLPIIKDLREGNKFTKDKLVARMAVMIAPIQPGRAA